jgi:hypothetical protein
MRILSISSPVFIVTAMTFLTCLVAPVARSLTGSPVTG